MASISVCVFLAGCGSVSATSASAPSSEGRHAVSDAAVCKALSAVASPLEKPPSDVTAFGKLAASAKNADIRREGKTLLKNRDPVGALASRPFFDIASTCVSEGFTSKDWAELI